MRGWSIGRVMSCLRTLGGHRRMRIEAKVDGLPKKDGAEVSFVSSQQPQLESQATGLAQDKMIGSVS